MPASPPRLSPAPLLLLALASLTACGDSDATPPDAGAPGSSGASGYAGAAGSGGSSGTSGQVGSSGTSGLGGAASSGASGHGAGGGPSGAGSGGSGGDCFPNDTCHPLPGLDGTEAAPPGPPAGGQPIADGENALLHGISQLYVGEADRDGTANADAWKKIGFDLDGWDSTPQQDFHCQPRSGGDQAATRTDGDHGIDNAFGQRIINGPLASLVGGPSAQMSLGPTDGRGTTVLDLGKIGNFSDYLSTPSQLYPALGQPAPGAGFVAPGDDWSGYAWRPLTEEVQPDGSARVQLPGAYMNRNVWVSGPFSPGVSLTLRLSLPGATWELPVERAVLALDVTDRQQGVGVLGGVLPTEKLVASFLQMAGGLGTQFCDPDSAVLQGITEALRQSSDIMVDRVQNPETECDAVSVGLGFDTRVTTLGDAATPEADSPCAP